VSGSAFNRRTFVKGAGAGAAALAMGVPAFIPRLGEAADAIKIGVLEPYTGTYAFPGENETIGIQMAIDAWNKKGGVMGRPIEIVKEDEQSKPDVAAQKARKLVNQDKCVALVGTVSSASSLSVQKASSDMGVLFFASGGHTDDVTGKNCTWNTFRTCHSTWMEAHATAYTLAKKFGKKFYFITPDYAYGHALQTAFDDVIKQIGGTTAGTDLTPLGTTDFSSYLTKVTPANPDVLVILVQGDDFTNCMKQADSFGLLKKFAVGGPQVELEPLYGLSPEQRTFYKGTLWGIEWSYSSDICLGKGNKVAHQFVSDYRAHYLNSQKKPPTARQCFGYVSVDRMLAGMAAAKSIDSIKVARAIEGEKFQSIFADGGYYRKEDHQLMWPMWVADIRPNGTPSDPNDLLNVIGKHDAASIEQSVAEKAKICKMAYPS
jgi:branched-chain amino acid transport system substrate-binding protein